jgi:sugar lactone lactonase YvrE
VRDKTAYVADGQNGKILAVSMTGTISTFAQGLDTPSAIAFDKKGNLFVADSGSSSIKKIDQSGVVSTFAGADGQAGYTDGEAANARFRAPIGIAVSEEGTVYVADSYNDRIRVIRDGKVYTLAGGDRGFTDGAGGTARFNTPSGIAVSEEGTVYVADSYNDRIRIIRDGRVYTLAGGDRGFADGSGGTARFNTPSGLAVTKDGAILVADLGNRRIRAVQPDGTTTTIAGSGNGELKDGLLGSADLVAPSAFAIDETGTIFVADGNAIRVIRQGMFPYVQTIAGGRRGLKDASAKAAAFSRPSGLALDANGNVFIADSDNQLVRVLSDHETGKALTDDEIQKLRGTAAEFRTAAPARWPYDPPTAKREIAGTLGELRGDIRPGDDDIHFHNGLDIVGSYGETARFVRDEKVLLPLAAENFGTLRELIRMPTMGYIHIRLGRDQNERPFGDGRFLFDGIGKLTDVRVPRGSKFNAGDPIGTLNPMNHVHLIAGRSGSEMNAMDALILPGIADSTPPTIESVSIVSDSGQVNETKKPLARIQVSGKVKIVVRAFDQVDGNAKRRRLGIYRAGYQLLRKDLTPVIEVQWNIRFDRLPPSNAVRAVYFDGSHSGATGETIFNYIVTNHVEGGSFSESDLDTSSLDEGSYILRAFAADYFDNEKTFDVDLEVKK